MTHPGDIDRGLTTSPVDQLVVKAIVGIARGMGKKTVAEFVVDEETACLPPRSARKKGRTLVGMRGRVAWPGRTTA